MQIAQAHETMEYIISIVMYRACIDSIIFLTKDSVEENTQLQFIAIALMTIQAYLHIYAFCLWLALLYCSLQEQQQQKKNFLMATALIASCR